MAAGDDNDGDDEDGDNFHLSVLLQDDNGPEYNMLGTNTCMGDHKVSGGV